MLLITPNEILQIAFPVDVELNTAAVRPSKIDIAQEHFLRSKIGDNLLKELIAGKHLDFTDRYIKPPLAYYVKYGLLDELAVAVDQSGVIVRLGNSSKASSTTQNKSDNKTQSTDNQSKTSDGQTQTTLQKTADELTKINQKAYHNDVDEENINRTETTGPSYNNTTEHCLESERSLLVAKNLEANDSKQFDSKISTTDSKIENNTASTTSQKEASVSSITDLSRNDSSQNSQFRPASIMQIQALKARALSDANILMRKALRYIQANPELFPNSSINPKTIF